MSLQPIPHSWGARRLREFNPNHEPAGSPQGGEFAKAAGDSTVKSEAPIGYGQSDGFDDVLGPWKTDADLPPAVRDTMLKAAALSFDHPFTQAHGPRETFWRTDRDFDTDTVVANVQADADYLVQVKRGESDGPSTAATDAEGLQFVRDVAAQGGIPGSANYVDIRKGLGDQRPRGLTSVHTHPSVSPFSDGDLGVFLNSHDAMYVVTANGDWYGLGWQGPAQNVVDGEGRRRVLAEYQAALSTAAFRDLPAAQTIMTRHLGSDDLSQREIARLPPAGRRELGELWGKTQSKAWQSFLKIPREQWEDMGADPAASQITFTRGRFRAWRDRRRS